MSIMVVDLVPLIIREDPWLLHPCAPSHRSSQRFPSRPRSFQHTYRCSAIKINRQKSHPFLADVRCRMILKLPFDHFGIGRGIVQSMALFLLRSAAASNQALTQRAEVSAMPTRVLRQGGPIARSVSAEGSTLPSRTKISSLDPSLTAVRPAHPAEPLPAFSDPPIERSCR
jgi:hypothetical protein